jgi:pyruvate formate-lyase activating enzyme-like uncharacterized protein
MILGSILELEGITKMDTKRLDSIQEVALDEIRTNPVIDEQLRTNQVVVRELRAAVSSALKNETRPSAEHPRAKDI